MLRRKGKTEGKGNQIKVEKKADDKKLKPLGSQSSTSSKEKQLENLVLGGSNDVINSLEKSVKKEEPISRKRRKPPGSLFEGDEKKPAWEDEDDISGSILLTNERKFHNIRHGDESKIRTNQYTSRIKSQFEKVSSTPNWAKLQSERTDLSDEDSDVEDLLQKTGNYLESSTSLPKDLIQIKQCTDANRESPSQGKLKSVEFHPTAQVILTAGMNQTLTLFQVDGKTNNKIQSVFVDNYPIHTAHFSANGEEVIMGSRHKSFYYYDMISGKMVNVPWIKGLEETNMKRFEVSPDGRFLAFLGSYGAIHLLSAKSKEWISTIRMNGNVESVAFSKDGKRLYSHGSDSEVYIWDMGSRKCLHHFIDDGCTHGTAIATSHNDQYLACGSYSGVVNIYDTDRCLKSRTPQPLKAIMNLTTSCTSAKFNSSTEILAIASDYTEKAVKLVHLPSMTVFSNFPDRTDVNLKVPMSLDFSVNSGYFSIATQKGQALLYSDWTFVVTSQQGKFTPPWHLIPPLCFQRIKHYGNY